MTRYSITQHFATTPKFKLAHAWWDNTLATDCGLPCAWEDGNTTKLSTGWVSAPLETIRCPACFAREL